MTSVADDADLIADVEGRLREVGRTVRRSMLDAMPDGEPAQWLYGADARVSIAAGQGVATRAVPVGRPGVRRRGDDLLGIAVAIELLHNAFLVHDDVADGSEMRRGRPTLAATYGMAAALNAGDGLAVVAGQVLRRGHPPPRP